ncbi:hypothetical protein ACIG8K_01175 [Streptomyces halstedii]
MADSPGGTGRMARIPHRDGRPELGNAAFDTVTLQTCGSLAVRE